MNSSNKHMMGRMAREIAEIPEFARRQVRDALGQYVEEGRRLRSREPRVILTCARGSSDHAATYFKYLTETRIGIPVASVGPSVASIYGAPLVSRDSVCVAVSQSGASPDIVALQALARDGGARCVAVVNAQGSPMAQGAHVILPVLAGQELAVAATKSFVASLIALCGLHAGMKGDRDLLEAMKNLPDVLAGALRPDWSAASDAVAEASSVFVLGRGTGLAIALEAALKFKETCRLHAEAYSSAEARHGPLALAGRGLTVLAFVPGDRAARTVLQSAAEFEACGSRVFLAGGDETRSSLPVAQPAHPALLPISQIVSFYRFVESLASSLGENPSQPPHLAKVTRTV